MLNIVVADLAIQRITLAGGITQVYAGNTVTYPYCWW